MFLTIIPVGLCVLGLIIVVGPLVGYLVDPKSLRKFPSPSCAAISSLWRIWHNVQYKHYLAIHNAHKDLGVHVRIAPNHVSILDPLAPHEVYGHGANMMKEAWYDAGAGAHRNLPDARNKYEHQKKRKLLAHAFAQKTIVGLEPLLTDTISSFILAIDRFVDSGERMNIRLYLNYFTIDLFGRLLYSKRMGCLDRGNDLVDAETKQGVVYKTPFIQSLLDATVLNTVLAMEPWLLPFTKAVSQHHPYRKAGNNFENIIYHHTKERLTQGTNLDDLFTRLLQDSKGNPLNLPVGEVAAECNSMMNAGTETTTAAMTNTVYLLYSHPTILTKLRGELDSVWPANGRATYDIVANVPYLRACIEESLRLRPASSIGLPRTVPAGGRVIAGKFIPEGVTVSVPTYSLLRHESVFECANEYIPDRWLTEDSEMKQKMLKTHLPFSTGPRACIGRNIAYFEQTLVIATLVRFFDLNIPEGFRLETQERFNSNPGDLFVQCSRRPLEL